MPFIWLCYDDLKNFVNECAKPPFTGGQKRTELL